MATSVIKNNVKMPDYSVVLATINTVGAMWTATENCCIAGRMSCTLSGAAILYVNGIEVCRGYPGGSSSGAITYPVFIMVKKGDTVSTRNINDNSYTLTAYALR